MDMLLDGVYAVLTFRHGEYSLGSFFIMFIVATCVISFISKGWNIWTEYKEFKKFELTIRVAMEKFSYEVGKEEDCGICMEKMKAARKLRCGHCFHQFCLMQMILNKKTTCPICRTSIYEEQSRAQQGHPRREEGQAQNQPQQRVDENANQNILGNIMQNVMMAFMRGGNAPRVLEADIARIQEVYPNMSREQAVQELAAHDSVEQTILAIAERL
eukprot:TRINITY_DN12943_c0_g1_i1.p1 TRINITY_DN12943_c0_g1~~TRINITY_DN12943_c0_g1_i1.p1  ORF type:complete len:215 (+),score=66.87 TRINITY_DN12943_c0_g1_i1:148-792(+)